MESFRNVKSHSSESRELPPVLVIMAAGLGSRYGGMKQIDGVGPHDEPIIEYSIYDALRAGFKRVVLVIKKEHESLFREHLLAHIGPKAPVVFAYQDMGDVPVWFVQQTERVKPWGTAHALLAAREIVRGPFAIINADDFYGYDAYRVMYDWLSGERGIAEFAMVGYRCENTLTDHGSVTRGVCEVSQKGRLTGITEVKKIIKRDDGAYKEVEGELVKLPDNSLVSMNFWGFGPEAIPMFKKKFHKFLNDDYYKDPEKAECLIPTVVGEMIKERECTVNVLSSKDQWFGVTYREDKPVVQENIKALIEAGVYPENLWQEKR